VISLVLLNIALHGLEAAAGVQYFPAGMAHAGRSTPGAPIVVRYADDLVAICTSREQADAVKEQLAEWLQPRGLTFNDDKTRIVDVEEGFDFLGFNIRRYPNGKLLIKPSKAAVQRIRSRLAAEVKALHPDPRDPGLGSLLPRWCVQGNFLRLGPLHVAAHLPVGVADASEQIETVGHGPLLRRVPPLQEGTAGCSATGTPAATW